MAVSRQIDSADILGSLSALQLIPNTASKFGAVADGSTDAAGAIQDDINDAASTGRGVTYLGPGTYIVGTTLDLPSGCSIVGVPGRTILKTKDSSDATLFENNDQTNGNADILLRDLILDGNKTNQTADGAKYAINFRRVENIVMENVEARNVHGRGIYMDGGGQVIGPFYLNRIWVHDNVQGGLSIQNAARRSTITNVLAENNGAYGVFFDASEGTHSNIHANRNGWNTNAFSGYAAGIHIRNVTTNNLVNLAAHYNYQEGIKVEGMVHSSGAAWTACQNGMLANDTYDDIYFAANSAVGSYGETRHVSIAGIVVGHNVNFAEGESFGVGKARYGINFHEDVSVDIMLTGVQFGDQVTGDYNLPTTGTVVIQSNPAIS